MKNARAPTEDNVRGDGVCETDSRIEVVVVAQVRLVFVSQAETQRQVVSGSPVALEVRRGLELACLDNGVAQRDFILRRQTRDLVVEGVEGESASEIIFIKPVFRQITAVETDPEGPGIARVHQKVAELPVVARIL